MEENRCPGWGAEPLGSRRGARPSPRRRSSATRCGRCGRWIGGGSVCTSPALAPTPWAPIRAACTPGFPPHQPQLGWEWAEEPPPHPQASLPRCCLGHGCLGGGGLLLALPSVFGASAWSGQAYFGGERKAEISQTPHRGRELPPPETKLPVTAPSLSSRPGGAQRARWQERGPL